MPRSRDLQDPLTVTFLLEVTQSSGEHRGQGEW
jgi:hypothetical protein